MSYGLLKNGQIEDNDWFGQEVKLRAFNNYGDWGSKEDAEAYTMQAMQDIYKDNGLKFKFNSEQHAQYLLDTVNEMMEKEV